MKNLIKNKKVLLLGFGREGQSTYQIIRKYLPEKLLTIADKDDSLKERLLSRSGLMQFRNEDFLDTSNKFILGSHYLDNLNEFDLIIKSPGISLKNIKYKIPFKKITSQTDIFLSLFSKQIIGVTGTKGKSTTSSLIYHIIHSFTDNVVLVGNIGIPPFEVISKLNKNTIIVFELSAHQLEYISTAPHISILLNIYQEHLDYYKSFNDYKSAKFNVYRFQNKTDYLIYNADDVIINNFIKNSNLDRKYFQYSFKKKVEQGCYIKNNTIKFCEKDNETNIYNLDTKRALKGEFNLLNIMASINACKILKIPDNYIVKGISTFKSLEHRLEYVGKFHNIHFYNDSIATIPESSMQAVKTLKNVDTLILGGYDRGIDYTDFIKFLNKSKISNIIFIGKAGIRIYNEIQVLGVKNKKYFTANNFEEVVEIAINNTKPEFICLLSPAAASYGMFKNFEERGDVYKKIVSSK